MSFNQNEPAPTALLSKTVKEVCKFHESVLAVYLFGSFAKGKEKKGSDIDLAFLFDHSFYKHDAYQAFAEAQLMGAETGKKLFMVVDVNLLNNASIIFAYEVVSTGLCIYERNRDERISFEVLTRSKFYDFYPFIKKSRKKKINSIIKRQEE
ncbi:MAG TPA: nucleotidyltransferase domain-containing protein [Thermodesulfovibrionia bacterium]|nr:nucleotidyltransferase domain-containing protein [Thermodesulfovibrionia bacterium]